MKLKHEVTMISILVLLSFLCYWIHFLIIKDIHEIIISFIDNLAFVFIQVLLVTLFIEQLLNIREKKKQLEKMNMAIGVFFSELGSTLLQQLVSYDTKIDSIRNDMICTLKWDDKKFTEIQNLIKSYKFGINCTRTDLQNLHLLLSNKKDFLLRLLENPMLLEHTNFTKNLWAIFHLNEELAVRTDISKIQDTDLKHINGDVIRVYGLLINQWIEYMKHLKMSYPYLYSLAVRTNPFILNHFPEVIE